MGKRKLAVLAVLAPLFLGLTLTIGYGLSDRPAQGPEIHGQPGYDVVVVGGDPEGVAAALSAARNGLKTLLVEEGEALGGLFTLGMLNFLDMSYGPEGELLTQGIFMEFYQDMGNAFDVEQAKAWFLKKAEQEKNLTLKLGAEVLGPVMEGKGVAGVVLLEEGRETPYYSLRVVDATVDADIAAQAGVPYTVGGEDYGERKEGMAVTLVFEVSGVNWDEVVRYLKADGNEGTDADGVSAWGYGKEAAQYEPADAQMQLRGPNLARQKNGNVLINALLIFGVDGLDPESKAAGIGRGLQEIPRIVMFMRERFAGFERAEFVGAASRLYVRETRHIQGEYRLNINDVMENADQWDRVAHGSYPVDIQATGPDNVGHVLGWPGIYSVPFRCLTPLEAENLLVVGRGASYDSLPHGSVRVVPVGMAVGEAAGAAAAWSVRERMSFREMTRSAEAMEWVQETLRDQGAYLTAYEPPRLEVMSHWAYDSVRVMRLLGLAEGGYGNDYGLDREVSGTALRNRLNKVLRLIHERSGRLELRKIQAPDAVTVKTILEKAAWGITGEEMDFEAAYAFLDSEGLLTEAFKAHVGNWEDAPDLALLYVLLAKVYETYCP
ncbi:MAG: FAD-dependent oxidoreductase [Peptococcaceae bacterium]|nr:FAD-dependent oxidoreductase [Peptococcaceae bacterium]